MSIVHCITAIVRQTLSASSSRSRFTCSICKPRGSRGSGSKFFPSPRSASPSSSSAVFHLSEYQQGPRVASHAWPAVAQCLMVTAPSDSVRSTQAHASQDSVQQEIRQRMPACMSRPSMWLRQAAIEECACGNLPRSRQKGPVLRRVCRRS